MVGVSGLLVAARDDDVHSRSRTGRTLASAMAVRAAARPDRHARDVSQGDTTVWSHLVLALVAHQRATLRDAAPPLDEPKRPHGQPQVHSLWSAR